MKFQPLSQPKVRRKLLRSLSPFYFQGLVMPMYIFINSFAQRPVHYDELCNELQQDEQQTCMYDLMYHVTIIYLFALFKQLQVIQKGSFLTYRESVNFSYFHDLYMKHDEQIFCNNVIHAENYTGNHFLQWIKKTVI